MARKVLMCIILLIIPLKKQAQDILKLQLNEIKEELNEFYKAYPQQKAFIHHDKQKYTVGENIWMKGYLVDAGTLRPDTLSDNLYIDLINPDKVVVQTIRLKLKNGLGHGDMPLRDTLPEGIYHIRAYTAWMVNFNPELIFYTTIYIKNPFFEHLIARDRLKRNRKNNKAFERKEKKYSASFHPEGGYLLKDIESLVGVKTFSEAGFPVAASGEIHHNKEKIASFKTDSTGFGTFRIKPIETSGYAAKIEFSNGKIETFDLKDILKTGTSIEVNGFYKTDSIEVLVKRNYPLTGDRVADHVFLLAHNHGQIHIAESIEILPDGISKRVYPKSVFTEGIIHFTIFDHRKMPLAERLALVNPFKSINYNILKSKVDTAGFSEVKIENLKAKTESPMHLSLALISKPANSLNLAGTNNIIKSLGVKSEIENSVNNINCNLTSPACVELYDKMLLTDKWRRFSWLKLFNDVAPEITYTFENKIVIRGNVTRELIKLPYKDADLELYVLNKYNDVFTAKTNDKGEYIFEGLDYNDTLDMQLRAYKPTGKKNLIINAYTGPNPDVSLPLEYFHKFDVGKGIANYKYYKDLYEDNRDSVFNSIHGKPSYVLWGEDIPAGTTNLFQAMSGRIPGVMVRGNSAMIRGPSSIYSSTEPLYLIDDIPVDRHAISSMNPADVDRIEVISGANASIYGTRGGNGVIAVYTKRGYNVIKGVLDFKLLGYATPREFSPLNNTPSYSRNLSDYENTTLSWLPDITLGQNKPIKILVKDQFLEDDLHLIIQGITSEGTPIYILENLKSK